ncbi:MAG: dTDP-4-dehydrorhamnose reductase [Bacteroidetes bacterium]|nr:MAG: dTDP-4-dehydrorhamnose reductase [Bacteroidota bacterium]
MKRALVFGAGGQLGSCLIRQYEGDSEVQFVGYSRTDLDITNLSEIERVLDLENPDVVINAAAYTAVDDAEGDIEGAWDVNARAPGFIAEACVKRGVGLLHISTDYVFNGEDGGTEDKPYEARDTVAPLGVYGRSKEAGERAIEAVMDGGEGRYFIVRTGWLYDRVGKNFLTTMVKLGSDRNEIKVVYDQRGTPTYTGSLSEAIYAWVNSFETLKSGIYHFSDEGVTCWASFARSIFEELKMDVEVLGITSSEYPTRAIRPMNSHLGGAELRELLCLEKRNWKESLVMCLDSEYERVKKRAEVWTKEPYDSETRAAVRMWLDEDMKEVLMEAFYKDIEFGTGGIRGICGPGTNRINNSIIAQATQGLVNYIKSQGGENQIAAHKKVAIAYDCRHQSVELAEVTARVLAGNGIEALLYPELRSTPQLSYTVRKMGCVAGVVITASHNPPEYNGYKVYWDDGAQIVAPHDAGIISEVRKIKSISDVKMSSVDIELEELITLLGSYLDEGYRSEILKLRRSESLAKKGSRACLVFTGLHGTGSVSVPPALKAFGFTNVHEVESQAVPDGSFPTVSSPNPEEGQALSEAISLGEKVGALLVMGTDPDADRVGLAVPNGEGGFQLLNGNETGALLFDYVLRCGRADGGIYDSSDFVATTVVTSPLLAEIGKGFGLGVRTTLTGFKHIAAAIAEESGKRQFIVGAEESYGYLIKDTARDKDAVSACCVLSELAHSLEESGETMLSKLEQIHRRFRLYQEGLVAIVKKGIDGAQEISDMMSGFRTSIPENIAGEKVVAFLDFESHEHHDLISSTVTNIDLPKSNVLQFVTEKGSRITVRPSGTEPKIKFYVSVNTVLSEKDDYISKRTELAKQVQELFSAFQGL